MHFCVYLTRCVRDKSEVKNPTLRPHTSRRLLAYVKPMAFWATILAPLLVDDGIIVNDTSACLRDPSQVVRAPDGSWHFWATHNPACTDHQEFPVASVHHYHATTLTAARRWNTSGAAVSPSGVHGGAWDAYSVFTPGAVYDPTNAKWYLWYGAVANGTRPTQESIGLVTSDSPFGPWARSKHNPVFHGSATPWCGGAGEAARVDEADAYVVRNRKLVVVKGVCANFTALPTAWVSRTAGTFDPPYTPLAGAAPMALAGDTAKRKGFEQARIFPGPDGQSDNSVKTLPTENLLEDTDGLLRPSENGGTKQPISDRSVR